MVDLVGTHGNAEYKEGITWLQTFIDTQEYKAWYCQTSQCSREAREVDVKILHL